MKISTEIGSLSLRVGEETAIRMFKQAGFDCFDLSMFSMARVDRQNGKVKHNGHPFEERETAIEYCKHLKQVADNIGIRCNQAHAPYPTNNEEIINLLPLSIECASILGAKAIVIHPRNNETPEQNKEFYLKLLPFAEKFHINIALENMWNWNKELDQASPAACSDEKNFKEHLDIINNPHFVACVDIGHAEMRGLNTTAPIMIRYLGDYVKCVHIHDNDKHRDLHLNPFRSMLDFESILDALVDIDYKGDMTLEADRFLKDYDDEHLMDGVNEMYKATRKLADMFEKRKAKKVNNFL